MKYYKVTIPVGYELYKFYKTTDHLDVYDLSTLELITKYNLESRSNEWCSDYADGDLFNLYHLIKITEIKEDDSDYDLEEIDDDAEFISLQKNLGPHY